MKTDIVVANIKAYRLEHGKYPATIKGDGCKFYESKRIREFLNRALDADIVRVYYMETTRPDAALCGTDARPTSLDLSSETYYLVTKSGNIVRMTNSEWGELIIAERLEEN